MLKNSKKFCTVGNFFDFQLYFIQRQQNSMLNQLKVKKRYDQNYIVNITDGKNVPKSTKKIEIENFSTS